MLFTLRSAIDTLILFITFSIKQFYSNSLALTNNTAINFITLNNTEKKRKYCFSLLWDYDRYIMYK